MTESPQQLEAQVPMCRRKIQDADLSARQRNILHTVVSWSFARGREWAEFESGEHLGILAGVRHRQHVWEEIKELQRQGVLQVKHRRGNWVRCRFLPSGTLVEPPTKMDPATLEQACALAENLNDLPDGFEPGGQGLLPLRTDAEHVDNDLAAASRDTAKDESAAIAALAQVGISLRQVRPLTCHRIGDKYFDPDHEVGATCHRKGDKSAERSGGLVTEKVTSRSSGPLSCHQISDKSAPENAALHITARAPRAESDSEEDSISDSRVRDSLSGAAEEYGFGLLRRIDAATAREWQITEVCPTDRQGKTLGQVRAATWRGRYRQDPDVVTKAAEQTLGDMRDGIKVESLGYVWKKLLQRWPKAAAKLRALLLTPLF